MNYFMRNEINNDNLYQEGSLVCAKIDPTQLLLITKYSQRIYYCTVVGHPEQNNLAFFESELILSTI